MKAAIFEADSSYSHILGNFDVIEVWRTLTHDETKFDEINAKAPLKNRHALLLLSMYQPHVQKIIEALILD